MRSAPIPGRDTTRVRHQIPRVVTELLERCPPDATVSRKDLLVVIRHTLDSDMRDHYRDYLDKLLDDNVLLGGSRTASDSLRAFAYSAVADLIHHIRQRLTVCFILFSSFLSVHFVFLIPSSTTVGSNIPYCGQL